MLIHAANRLSTVRLGDIEYMTASLQEAAAALTAAAEKCNEAATRALEAGQVWQENL